MIDKKEYLKVLLKKFEAGKCNSEELKFIDDWYSSLDEIGQNQVQGDEVSKMEIKSKMWESILPELKKTKKNKFRQQRISLFFKSIAAVFIGCMCFLWFRHHSRVNALTSYTTISVPGGQIKKVVLADSTIIWLNNNSKIKYPDEFKAERVVYLLEGEAFFTVTHDSKRPFTVYTSSGIAVEDLGTEFNIKSYSALGFVKISVLKGKVAVKDSVTILTELNKNEGVFVDKTMKNFNKIAVENLETDGWRNGEIVLNNVSFNELALAIENNYQVSLTYNNESLRECRSSISFKSTDKLKDIMDDLAIIYKFQYAIDKNQVQISGKGCK